uniref:Uncharacterized protein n=1 Tax=Anguilla anguilla TaxID=7936 RepID=A0A0E9SHC5_ANGAN
MVNAYLTSALCSNFFCQILFTSLLFYTCRQVIIQNAFFVLFWEA